MKQLMLGNEAIARGAYEAGVRVAVAYPGTPSTEITENMAKYSAEEVYCEWAPNEKVALEVAIGASMGGARAMCCMKHVGVNVAADLLSFSRCPTKLPFIEQIGVRSASLPLRGGGCPKGRRKGETHADFICFKAFFTLQSNCLISAICQLPSRGAFINCPINESLNISPRERIGRSEMCSEYCPTNRLVLAVGPAPQTEI